jgi:ubiquinone/menaquinone biosynthesis C-methylase UbiE
MRSQDSQAAGKELTSLDYSKKYYEEHAQAGLDYLGHGYWQESYAKMVVDATQQPQYLNPFIIDAGCACGSILQGFRKTGVFDRVVGIDLSKHMINIGKNYFKFGGEELVHGSIASMNIASDSATLVHTAQVLEHIPDEFVDKILSEFQRVLRPGGRAFVCLDAIRTGETREMYMGDPTHVNIQPIEYWARKFHSTGFFFDIEGYNRLVRSQQGPTEGDPRSFFEQYPYWSLWILQKIA